MSGCGRRARLAFGCVAIALATLANEAVSAETKPSMFCVERKKYAPDSETFERLDKLCKESAARQEGESSEVDASHPDAMLPPANSCEIAAKFKPGSDARRRFDKLCLEQKKRTAPSH